MATAMAALGGGVMFVADNLLLVISLHFTFIFAKEVPSHVGISIFVHLKNNYQSYDIPFLI